MHRTHKIVFGAIMALLLLGPTLVLSQQEQPKKPIEVKEVPKIKTDNTNALLKEYKGKITVTASTFWPTWEPSKVIDGNLETSWFSNRGDAAAKGTKPWVMLEFPQDETVKRVTVLGNREPAWLTGYTILAGTLEFRDKDQKRLWFDENEGVGNLRDFDFKPKTPIKNVRFIRFTSTRDQGDKNPYDDIAIAEIQIE